MHPTLVREPFAREGVYEEKYDGRRMLPLQDGASVLLVTRNGAGHTERLQQIAAEHEP
jgi:ATP-dependent DNA ligase